jgi:sugar phosphate isomerase/epimerase
MWKTELCIGLLGRAGMSDTEQLDLIQAVGFDGFFPVWTEDRDLKELTTHGAQLGLKLQSVHAPFGKVDSLWYPNEFTQMVMDRTLACFRASAEVEAPFVVIHPFITFQRNEATQAGIDHYGILVEDAKKLGVRIAIENVEGEAYLDALMRAFQGQQHVGFCWDTGHEMCYNRHRDLLASYGDRLFGTHLNDNLGIKDPAGNITFHDDLHLLPFDGIADWQGITARLKRSGYTGPLTFELKRDTTLNGRTLPIYGQIGVEEYFTQAYIRACRVAALLQK